MTSQSEHVEVVISVGSNIEKERHLPEAIRLLRRHRNIEVRDVSRFYESEAVGGAMNAPSFLNAAVVVRTDLGPEELRAELRAIEQVLGRVRTGDKNAPRTIDLDVVYYADLVKDFGEWEVPDPQATSAAHIAVPLAEVAPEWVDPRTGQTALDAMLSLDGDSDQLRPVADI